MAERTMTGTGRDGGPFPGPARHDMVFLGEDALAFARRAACRLNAGLSAAEAKRLLTADIPAIVTRQTRRPKNNIWQAGFSLPMQNKGARMRFRTRVPMGGALRRVTPFDVLRGVAAQAEGIAQNTLGDTPRAIFTGLAVLGARCGLEAGVYGSLALQILTGRPYLTEDSDYDIFLRATAPRPNLPEFYGEALALGARYGMRLDMEIACLADSGAKLAEVLSGQKTVLCKGLYGVRLCPASELGLVVTQD